MYRISGCLQPAPDRPPKQKVAKAARKFQVAMKSAALRSPVPSDDWEIEGEHDINHSVPDSDVVVDESANENQTDTSENDEPEEDVLEYTEPSQTLLDSLEWLSSSVVRLHKMRRLPFLRRNLRRGFRLHCRMAGVDTKPQSLPRASISVVYSCPLTDAASSHSGGLRTTSAKSSMKEWLCPLCDLHKKFNNPIMLEKHLAWDHSSVEVLWDQVRLLYLFEAFVSWCIQRHTMLSLTIPDSQPPS